MTGASFTLSTSKPLDGAADDLGGLGLRRNTPSRVRHDARLVVPARSPSWAALFVPCQPYDRTSLRREQSGRNLSLEVVFFAIREWPLDKYERHQQRAK
jgi:hypothetical protein